MFCPECRAEFRSGFDRCADCDIPLVPALVPEDHSGVEYVVVYETSRPSDIPVIKSLLRGADIPFMTEGESLDRLFPSELHMSMIDGGHPLVHFKVPVDRAEETLALLDESPDFESPTPDELTNSDD